MKYLQSAFFGFLLTVTAAAQTATTLSPQGAPVTVTVQSSAPAVKPQTSTPPQISSLGGDTVKGPEHPLTLDQMKVLYVAMGYDKQVAEMDANREKMIAQNKTQNPYMPNAVWDDLDSSFKKVDYETAIYDVYKKYLSTEDAAKLIEFSKTEAGKDYFANAATLTRESMIAMQRQQQQVGQQVQARHKDEIEAAMKKFQEERQKAAAAQTPGGSGTAAPGGSSTTASPASSSGSGAATAPASSGSSSSSKPATPPASSTPQN